MGVRSLLLCHGEAVTHPAVCARVVLALSGHSLSQHNLTHVRSPTNLDAGKDVLELIAQHRTALEDVMNSAVEELDSVQKSLATAREDLKRTRAYVAVVGGVCLN